MERDGVAVHFDTRKAIALLAFLAISSGAQSRDVVASLLWEGLDSSGARSALRRTLSTLKSALHDPALESDRRTIRLRPDNLEVDVHRFRNALDLVRDHGHDVREGCKVCLPTLLDAVSLYRDDFLTGFALRDSPEFDGWQLMHAEALRRDLAEALEGMVDALYKDEQFEKAIEFARRWLNLDPLHEAAHRTLMQLFSQTGERSSALRQYRECVKVLDEELSVSPVEETTRLYQAIKEHDESPAMPPRRAPSDMKPFVAQHLPLVGRAREWETLRMAHEVMHNGAYIVALEGEAGIGKTRLMYEFLEYARSSGTLSLSARCFEGESGLAYAPIIQLLRGALDNRDRPGDLGHVSERDLVEISRLLPEIDAARATGVDLAPNGTPGAQTRFLDAICHVLLAAGLTTPGECPLILALDDLQWADVASLECLAYILRRLGAHRVGVVLAWRSEDLGPVRVVRRVIAEAQRAGKAAFIPLERLNRESVGRLVETVAAAGSSVQRGSDLGRWLFEETEGLPLFVAEYLAALSAGSTSASLDASLPLGVSELLLSRLSNLSETGSQFLAAAAVVGRSFDFDTLREISGRDEEMAVTALEELSRLRLVHEVEGETAGDGLRPTVEAPIYDFLHYKLRVLVYDRTSLARRRLLHRRVADVLINRSRSGREDSAAAQIAYHYYAAGVTDRAAEFYKRAGAYARAIFANREAVANYEAALALDHSAVGELQEVIGDLHLLLGEYRSAVGRYEAAAALAEGHILARLDHKLGNAYHRWGEWELAESYYEEAVATLGNEKPAERARIYADWSMASYHRSDSEHARQLARNALTLAEEVHDAGALAQAHNMLGVLEDSRGNRAAARDHLTQSLALSEALPQPGARIAALQNLAFVQWHGGNFTEALQLAGEALRLCATQGDRHREAALHNTMADLLHAQGDEVVALTHVKQAVAIYAEIGVEAGEVRPEVWKLTEW